MHQRISDPVPVVAALAHETELLALHDALRKLERDFKLNHRFNLFEALNITRQEVRHSRFIAFLLDPLEPHGLGDRFLRAMLLAAADEHPQLPVSRLALSIQDLSDVTVQCERDHFDISVQLPSLQLLFVVENKIDAPESDSQLNAYRNRAAQRYPNLKFMGTFLTPDGYDGEDDLWGALSYVEVATCLRDVMEEVSISEEARLVLSHYLDLIERKIVTSQALIDACREVYRVHKKAFELVAEHGQQSVLALAFEQFVSDKHGLKSTATRSGTVFFLHEDWLLINKALVADRKRWSSEFPVLAWFQLGPKALHFRIEVGPLQPEAAEGRKALVESFRAAYGSSGKRESPTFTRVRTVNKKVPEDPTMEDVLAAMNELWDGWHRAGGMGGVGQIVDDWAKRLPQMPPVAEPV